MSVCNCMPCSTLFLYIVDYEVVTKYNRSFRHVFSGREERTSFSIICMTVSCKTAARFCLPLLPGCPRQWPLSMSPRRYPVPSVSYFCGKFSLTTWRKMQAVLQVSCYRVYKAACISQDAYGAAGEVEVAAQLVLQESLVRCPDVLGQIAEEGK